MDTGRYKPNKQSASVSCAQAEVGEQLWPSCGGVASHEIPNKPDPTLLTKSTRSHHYIKASHATMHFISYEVSKVLFSCVL